MDGIDIVRVHWTQEHPEAPLKMEILNYGEVEFDGTLKGAPEEYEEREPLVADMGAESPGNDRNRHANDPI